MFKCLDVSVRVGVSLKRRSAPRRGEVFPGLGEARQGQTDRSAAPCLDNRANLDAAAASTLD